jgi:16S rRNA (guanine527-N7)-methyltransferase
MGPNPADDTMDAALARHDIALAAGECQRLEEYARLLWHWNAQLNLTRHTDFERFVSRDVVDSLALSRHLLPGESVLDVGTGGGVPGVVLAIVRADLKVSLSESVAKKHKAVSQIVQALRLGVPVHHERAEAVVARERFDALVVRAVAPLCKLLTWFGPYWDQAGRLLVIKGPRWIDERKEARQHRLLTKIELRCVERYTIEGTGAQSVVLELKPAELQSGSSGPPTSRALGGRGNASRS